MVRHGVEQGPALSLGIDRRARSAIAISASAVFLACWILIHVGPFGRSQIRDTPRYEIYGRAIAAGKVPYRDFSVEYPPGALLPFLAPVWPASHTASSYRRWFDVMMAAVGLGLVWVTTFAAVDGRKRSNVALPALFVAFLPLLLGTVVLTRFDLCPALLAAGGVWAAVAGMPLLTGALLGLGTVTKIYPAVIFPIAAVYLFRRHGTRSLVRVVAAAVAAAAVVVPLLVIAPHGLVASFTDQANRPLQIETLGASLGLAAHQLYGQPLGLDFSHSSQNLGGSTFAAIATMQVLVQALVVIGCWFAFARGEPSTTRLLRYSAAAVAAFAILGKVLSPQYLIWLVPLVALVRGRRGAAAATLLGAAMLTTQVWFPRRYWALVLHFDGIATWALVARNLLLLGLLAALLVPEKLPVRLQERPSSST